MRVPSRIETTTLRDHGPPEEVTIAVWAGCTSVCCCKIINPPPAAFSAALTLQKEESKRQSSIPRCVSALSSSHAAISGDQQNTRSLSIGAGSMVRGVAIRSGFAVGGTPGSDVSDVPHVWLAARLYSHMHCVFFASPRYSESQVVMGQHGMHDRGFRGTSRNESLTLQLHASNSQHFITIPCADMFQSF